MKIYTITSGDYSDYHIDAVFSTKEKAQQWIDANSKAGFPLNRDYGIETYTIDGYDGKVLVPIIVIEIDIITGHIKQLEGWGDSAWICPSEKSNVKNQIEYWKSQWVRIGYAYVKFRCDGYIDKPTTEKIACEARQEILRFVGGVDKLYIDEHDVKSKEWIQNTIKANQYHDCSPFTHGGTEPCWVCRSTLKCQKLLGKKDATD